MTDDILTINAGSSSLKFALFEQGAVAAPPALLLKGEIEGIGTAPHFHAADARGAPLVERRWPEGAGLSHEALCAELLPWIETHRGAGRIAAAGHRVVHGGTEFTRPVKLDESVLARLDRLVPLAPLHQPHNLAAIRALANLKPGLRQIACFDTAFHAARPAVATRFALPRSLAAEGVLRYGFHGLSYEYIAGRLAELDPVLARGRVVVAHLGAGASLCAMAGGRSVDTTMGFTALDGLPMGTRCGALDPGVVLYLLEERGMSGKAIEDLLYHRSGLLGVSGISSDMRALLASDAPEAAEAVELFVYRIARELGALTATLGGLDGIVFTAGIGEHAPEIRRRVCALSGWLGLGLDEAANARGGLRLHRPESRVAIWAIPTDEEAMIARHTVEMTEDDVTGGDVTGGEITGGV